MYGFGKNERATIDDKETQALKLLATQFLAFGKMEIQTAVEKGVLIQVQCDGKT
jgi:hypothetical protein